jgi:hypothetical protein
VAQLLKVLGDSTGDVKRPASPLEGHGQERIHHHPVKEEMIKIIGAKGVPFTGRKI